MTRVIHLMFSFLVVVAQVNYLQTASSRSPRNNRVVLVILENKDESYHARDSNNIELPEQDDRISNNLVLMDFSKRQNINTGVSLSENDENIWTNRKPRQKDETSERKPNNWSKSNSEGNKINNNETPLVYSNIGKILSGKSTSNSRSFNHQNNNRAAGRESLFLNPEIERHVSHDNEKAKLQEERVETSTRRSSQRLCEKKYTDYMRIIFPQDEDTVRDADVVDFDGRLLAEPGEYPHMTALGFETEFGIYDYKCGGSLISENFVISAAHCANVSGQAPSIARVGDLNLRVVENSVDPVTRDIKRIHVHPDYDDQLYYNDIALVELRNSIIFSPDVRPIRLWTRADAPVQIVFAMGYGSTAFGKALTRQLTYLNLTIVPNNECRTSLPIMPEAPRGIISSQLCAFDYLMKRDTCQGDSGGPLQYTLKGRRRKTSQHHLLLGIISYGLYCRSNYPSVYTRVSSYLDWIEEVVWN